jgi:hypothetical protein
MTETITFTISKELREKIDLTRGDIPRSKFISRSLEAFFNNRALTKEELAAAAQCMASCRGCIGSHRNIQSSKIYCKCQCHKKTALALTEVEGPAANAYKSIRQPSTREVTQENDY